MTATIAVDHLCKYFRRASRQEGIGGMLRSLARSGGNSLVKAVDGVSFTIGPGELVGYLGPNGAGKSTTIKMLTGLLVPTHGSVQAAGFVPWRERRRYVAHIGAVFGQRTTLWWDLPVIDSLNLMQHLYRIPAERFRQNLDEFRKLLDLDAFLHTPVRSLSLGQRMRADLAAALLHEPDLVFLDEPTIGLDVVAKERIRLFIQHLNRQRGTTVLLTTHDLQDVERLCERIMILDQGRLLYDGSLVGIQERFGGQRAVVVDFAEAYTDVSLPGLIPSEWDGERAVYTFDRTRQTASEIIALLSERFTIRDLQVREPSLEDTIRRIYQERLLV